ncbi:MmcB family DNA repair protein [Kordiimonas gwangyangensis]|uniref:MmcB family DNA repair protein n=1 Tax=Kordiimonas gwangyangensis TaxID=288022 RepID=UPI000364E1BA|nr:MmcB family DNA repair protein [Kordiimonas gwangyangensis]
MTSTEQVTRGAMRFLLELGYAPMTEVSLTNGRRADIVALDRAGRTIIVEVKSSLADFRSDSKWQEYLSYCEEFFFAVDGDFPRTVLDEDGSLPSVTGVILADAYGADIVRPAATRVVNAAKRKTLTLKMARLGAMRLTDDIKPLAAAPRITSLL